MTFKLFLLSLLLLNLAHAQELDWLKPFLLSKAIKCNLSTGQLKAQLTTHLDTVVKQIGESLRAQGSEFESIAQERDHVDIEPVPNQPVFDFFVRQSVTVIFKTYTFQVQTTYVDSESMKTEKSLWLPLTVRDTGVGQDCKLERIAIPESQRKFLPRVDLVIGEPARVAAGDLAQVMDISEQPTQGHTVAVGKSPGKSDGTRTEKRQGEQTETRDQKRAEKSAEQREEKRAEKRAEEARESRREGRRDARKRKVAEEREAREERESKREKRRKQREQRRKHRRQRVEQEQQVQPERQNECAGDVSPWKAIGCAVTGNK